MLAIAPILYHFSEGGNQMTYVRRWPNADSDEGYTVTVDYGSGDVEVRAKPSQDDRSEFAKFQDLTSNLVAVPKSEADEEREKS
jgi:hypothetical protein